MSAREIRYFGNKESKNWFIQPVDQAGLEEHAEIYTSIAAVIGRTDWCLVCVQILDWNKELSPWVAPPVFGKQEFGGEANVILDFIIEEILQPNQGKDKHFFLCGYSLAGLFALWAACETTDFEGVVAASPSVWFPGWREYANAHEVHTQAVYLSLGDKEEKAKNPTLASVGNAIRAQYQLLHDTGVICELEWNQGNHFVDYEIRMAKGISWLLNNNKLTELSQ